MAISEQTELRTLPGVGPERSRALARLGLQTMSDLLEYFPRDYEDRTVVESIREVPDGTAVCFEALVTERFHTAHIRRGMDLTKGKVANQAAQVDITFFNQSYVAQQLIYGETYLFYGKLSGTGVRREMSNPYFERRGKEKFTGGIMPLYPLTAGITQNRLAGLVRKAMPLASRKEETLSPFLLNKYQLAQVEFSYRNIHFPESWEALGAARRRLIFEELLCLSLGLAFLRDWRVQSGGIAFIKKDVGEFLKTLPYALTSAQKRAIHEMAEDVERARPMSRLLQGDVGSGKTVVAAAMIWLAWKNGCQSAFMAPTELLAQQHERTLRKLLGDLGLRIGLLTGSQTAANKRKVREAAKRGELDLLIGTHALLTEEVVFSRLGLVVTDEQHRFGVQQRAILSGKGSGSQPHTLIMSATPIPRTLAFMIYGDLDLSVIDELPPGRKEVETYVVGEDKRQRLYGFIRRKVEEGRQVYIVCPTVEEGGVLGLKSAQQYGEHLQKEVFPDLSIGIIHGRMKAKEKEKIMALFAQGELSVLVSTTVIEVGVDVPNAALMVIENAERFGLSQLHQLRGRVGRGEYSSYCILVSDSKNPDTVERLKVMRKTTDGFRIAEEDLKLRGPGDFFGERQHGLPYLRIADLAGDTRLLKDAQEAAHRILEEDPTLQEVQHQPLRRKMQKLFEERAGSFQ